MAIKFDELLEALDPSLDKFEEDLDSMWIIIPTERRYDDLTASDYDEFINKYGTFNSRQECWDKIDKLAPDRWDAFIPLRIDGVNESLNESLNDKYLYNNKYSNLDDKTFFKKIKNKIKYACKLKNINNPKIIQDSWGITVKSDDFSNFKTPEEFDEFAKLCGFKEPADIGYDHISFNYDWQYPEQFDESLKEDYLDPYIDELAMPLSKYMQMNSKHFNAVCDYIDDELRKPGRGLSELSKRDLETLYSVFIEGDRFNESLNLKEDIESSNDELFYKAYDVYPEYMEPILADLGYTEDNCETLEDIPRDAKRKAFSLWLKEMRERAAWNDDMPSAVYDIIDLVDSSNLGESLNESLKDKNSFIDWLSEHEQAYKDACNYFHTDNLSLIDAEKLENWLYDHEQLAKDYSNHFNTSLNEAANKEKYKVTYEPYERYGSTGLKRATFTASSVFEALCKVCDNLLLNIDLEEIEEEGFTAEDIIDRFSFTNGDGCDYIYTIENLNTGDIIFDGSDMYDDMDDWDLDESLTEAVNHENDEINALLRQYVGKKTIPAKARKAIEDAGIKINFIEPWHDDFRIEFEGPNGKKLTAVHTKGDTTDRIGPKRPMHHGRGYYGAEGRDDNKRTDYWDLHNRKNYTWSSNGVQYPRNIYKDSWDKVDLKGYLDSNRDNNYEDYNDISNPGYLGRYNKYAEEQREEAKSLRPYSDEYKHLKSQLSAAKYKKDVQKRLRQTYDKNLDQEEDKYNKQIPKHIEDSKNKHRAKSKNKQ